MKIVFMGTPRFAQDILCNVLENKEHQVVGVFTKAPKPSGRGKKTIKTEVHVFADEHDIPIFYPYSLKDQESVEILRKINPDVVLVVAYGLILTKDVLDIPKYGCINIHPSSLPRWRGAAPIERTIMHGDKDTSFCIMQMDEGLDTGDILLQSRVELDDVMTSADLYRTMADIAKDQIPLLLTQIEQGAVQKVKQAEDNVTYAKKIDKAEAQIDWNKTAEEINCLIRSLSPKPGAYFMYKGEIIKIITAEYTMQEHDYCAGEVINDDLDIACSQGVIKPTLLQRQGRKMIYKDAFLRGFNIPKSTKI